jgi:hypothetical protein
MRFIVEKLRSGDTLFPGKAESSFLWRVWQGTALAVRQDEGWRRHQLQLGLGLS